MKTQAAVEGKPLPFPTCPACPQVTHIQGGNEAGMGQVSHLASFLGGSSVIYGSAGRAHQAQLFQLTFPVSFQVEVKSNGV